MGRRDLRLETALILVCLVAAGLSGAALTAEADWDEGGVWCACAVLSAHAFARAFLLVERVGRLAARTGRVRVEGDGLLSAKPGGFSQRD